MNGPLDLSNLPTAKWGDDVWFAMIVPDEIAKLTRLHEAILKWDQLSSQEFANFQVDVERRRTPLWDQYGYDPLADEGFMLLGTQRVMLANLGVGIAACAENFVVRVCKARGVNCMNGKRQTDYGIACNSLGSSLNVVIAQLPGYGGNQRARVLGNCFKHSEGKRNDRFVEKFGGAVGEDIEYETENWPGMIEDTRTLLTEITQRLRS